MRRRVVGVAAVIGLVVAVGFAGLAVATTQHTHAFTETDLGAAISMHGTSVEQAAKTITSLNGTGAGVTVSKVSSTAFPLTGSDTGTAYYANGVSKTKDTFKLATPNAKGISTITGSGKCVGGTRIHKHEKCSYTFTGTYDTKTTITKVESTGTSTR